MGGHTGSWPHDEKASSRRTGAENAADPLRLGLECSTNASGKRWNVLDAGGKCWNVLDASGKSLD